MTSARRFHRYLRFPSVHHPFHPPQSPWYVLTFVSPLILSYLSIELNCILSVFYTFHCEIKKKLSGGIMYIAKVRKYFSKKNFLFCICLKI